jgi:hypothetical protein
VYCSIARQKGGPHSQEKSLPCGASSELQRSCAAIVDCLNHAHVGSASYKRRERWGEENASLKALYPQNQSRLAYYRFDRTAEQARWGVAALL